MIPKALLASLVVPSIVFASAQASADETPSEDRPIPATEPRALDPARAARQAGNIVLDDMFGFGFVPSAAGIGGLAVRGGWFTYGSATSETTTGSVRATSLAFAPSADVFVIEGLSLGGTATIGRASVTTTSSGQPGGGGEMTSTSIRRSIAPRVGYAIPVTREIFVWPRAFVELGSTSVEMGTSGTGGVLSGPASGGDGSFWAVGGDVQAVFAISTHVLLGIGPRLLHQRESRDEPHAVATATSLGINGSMRLVF